MGASTAVWEDQNSMGGSKYQQDNKMSGSTASDFLPGSTGYGAGPLWFHTQWHICRAILIRLSSQQDATRVVCL
jgi:hypothetical protein